MQQTLLFIRLCVCVGDVESTQPTKMLMRIAEYVDSNGAKGEGGGRGGGGREGGELREWFLNNKAEVLDLLAREVGRHERAKSGCTHFTPDR